MKAQAGNDTTSLAGSNPFLFRLLKRKKETQIFCAMSLAQKLRVSASPAGPLVVNYLIYGT